VVALDPKTGNRSGMPRQSRRVRVVQRGEARRRDAIVGHDAETLGGWTCKTGKRL